MCTHKHFKALSLRIFFQYHRRGVLFKVTIKHGTPMLWNIPVKYAKLRHPTATAPTVNDGWSFIVTQPDILISMVLFHMWTVISKLKFRFGNDSSFSLSSQMFISWGHVFFWEHQTFLPSTSTLRTTPYVYACTPASLVIRQEWENASFKHSSRAMGDAVCV